MITCIKNCLSHQWLKSPQWPIWTKAPDPSWPKTAINAAKMTHAAALVYNEIPFNGMYGA